MNRRLSMSIAFWMAMFLAVLFGPSPAHALITGDFGNKPVVDHGWPEGSLAIANRSDRLGWWEGPPFGGGEFTFLYRGDAKAFNEALAMLDKINWPAVELHIHSGPHDDFWLVERDTETASGEKPSDKKADEPKKKRDPRIDWSFTIWTPRNFHHLYNNPTTLFGSDRPEFRKQVPPPRIDIYLGGGLIDWNDVQVPKRVRVVGDPADVLKDQPPRIRVQVYDMLTSKPVPKATARLVVSDSNGQRETQHATTADNGECVFEKLEPGTYNINLEANGYAARSLGWEQYAIGDDKAQVTELSPETRLAGRVVNTQNQPIVNAEVHTFTVLGVDGRGYTQPVRAEVKTDAEGRFELKLPTGYAQLSARAPTLYHSWTEILQVGRLARAGDSAQPVIIRMEKTTKVTVNVTDAAGKPLAGKSVYLNPTGNPIGKWGGSATSNDKGQAVIDGVPPGEYQITEQPFPPKSGKVIRIDEGKPAMVDVAL